MRKIYILVVFVMAAASCSKWLDITPENMIVEKDLYKTGTGFQNALNGIYGDLTKGSLYGKELTYGFVDVLSQNYVVGNSSVGIKRYSYYTDVAAFKYNDNAEVKSAINQIWSSGYSAIANCNILLAKIDPALTVIFEGGQMEKDLIKGEALGVRAMMHFDLLRMFAASPLSGGSKLHIPYVTVSPYYGGQAPETVESVMGKIEKDLLEAKDLIMKYDTADYNSRRNLHQGYRFELTQTETKPVFFAYRGYRLNAVAINGLLARFYNYWGKHEEAKKYAEVVINFVAFSGTTTKVLRYTTSSLAHDRKFTQDLFFAVSDVFLQPNYFGFTVLASHHNLMLNKKMVLFEGHSTSHAADTRFANLIDKSDSRGYLPYKNVRKESSEKVVGITADMIPMMRLSEMDFIMSEYYASVGDFVKAEQHINNVRVGRKCSKAVLGITDMKSFKANLFIEARKEFFQEGQIFYYYKKYNELINEQMTPESFIIPVPESETIN